MDFVQINCIDFDKIENPQKLKWLENLPDEFNYYFVEVLDGDFSLVRDFDLELVPASYIPDDSYITCSGIDNEQVISTLQSKGYEKFAQGFASDIYIIYMKQEQTT